MTKHLGYYHGPAKVTVKIGTRQYEMEYEGKSFTRDMEMIIPQAQLPSKFHEFDPTEEPEETRKPSCPTGRGADHHERWNRGGF